jgi:SPP1 family predicted phage head-tail adaptor
VPVWSLVATVWGSVEPLRGREFMDARTQANHLDTRIRLRHRPGIVPEMRVLWTDDNETQHTYNVESAIRPLERKRELHLMCSEAL